MCRSKAPRARGVADGPGRKAPGFIRHPAGEGGLGVSAISGLTQRYPAPDRRRATSPNRPLPRAPHFSHSIGSTPPTGKRRGGEWRRPAAARAIASASCTQALRKRVWRWGRCASPSIAASSRSVGRRCRRPGTTTISPPPFAAALQQVHDVGEVGAGVDVRFPPGRVVDGRRSRPPLPRSGAYDRAGAHPGRRQRSPVSFISTTPRSRRAPSLSQVG